MEELGDKIKEKWKRYKVNKEKEKEEKDKEREAEQQQQQRKLPPPSPPPPPPPPPPPAAERGKENHHSSKEHEKKSHSGAKIDHASELKKKRAVLGMLMPALVKAEDKLAIAFLQLEETHLLFCKLYYKGGGKILSVDTKKDKVSMAKWIFSDVEAFPFGISIKEKETNWQRRTSPRANKDLGSVYKLAPSTLESKHEWIQFLTPVHNPRDDESRDRTQQGDMSVFRNKAKFDFLWVRRQNHAWARYFCVAFDKYIEWFTLGPVKAVPLENILSIDEGIKAENLRTGRAPSKIRKHLFSKFSNKLVITYRNEYGFENTVSFYTRSQKQLEKWKKELSKNMVFTENVANESLDPKTSPRAEISNGIDHACDLTHSAEELSTRVNLISVLSDESEVDNASQALSQSIPTVHSQQQSKRGSVLSLWGTGDKSQNSGTSMHYSSYYAVWKGTLRKKSQRKYSLEDIDLYSKWEPRKRLFTPTIQRDWSAKMIHLRNVIREYVEKAKNETGHTTFGDYDVSRSNNDDGQFRILCLDGGGLKSILEAVILERLVARFPDLLEKVDLFAGVSGGSILSSCIAVGRSPTFIKKLMKKITPYLVEGERSMNTVAGFGVKKAKYTHATMCICGEEILKGITLRDVPKKLMVTSFLLDNIESRKEGEERTWKSRAYHNIPLRSTDEEWEKVLDTPVWDYVMMSSSAPTFFPSYRKHVDGGVVSNNASLTAAITVMGATVENPKKASDIHVLSLGTGTVRRYIEGDVHDWGLVKWGPQLTGLLLGAANNNVDFLTSTLLGDNYHRMDPPMEKQIAMDDPHSTNYLIKLGEELNLDDTIEWIQEHFYDQKRTEKEEEQEEQEEDKGKEEKGSAARRRKALRESPSTRFYQTLAQGAQTMSESTEISKAGIKEEKKKKKVKQTTTRTMKQKKWAAAAAADHSQHHHSDESDEEEITEEKRTLKSIFGQ